jgi:hypothetical protein
MRFSLSWIALVTVLSPFTSAANVPYDGVAAYKAILIALKASAFCSWFVPITDVTPTSTQTGTLVSTHAKIVVSYGCQYNSHGIDSGRRVCGHTANNDLLGQNQGGK